MFVLCTNSIVLVLFMPVENFHHFSNFFQLMSVFFSCAVSYFLYEEFSAMPIRA